MTPEQAMDIGLAKVRFTRMTKGQWYIEIDCWDRQQFDKRDIVTRLEELGFRCFTGAGFRLLALRRGWNAPRGFVALNDLF